MKTPENLLRLLGVQNYTQRHIQIINDFIKSGEEDVKKLLDRLGGWDSNDLKQAELWMESLSSNDKQEKKPTETGEVIASYDEVKYTEELIKKLNYNTVYTCDTRKSEGGSVSTFKKDLLYTPAGWIGLDDGYIVTSVLIPVYYPEKKGGE